MRRLAVGLLALALLPLPAASGQKAEGLASGWSVALEITSEIAGAKKMFEAFDTASLSLYDLNGDGQLEIVTGNDNNRVYVLDARTGRALAELTTYHYNTSYWPVRELNPVAIGDLYGDGVPCMVVPNSASFLTAFCFNAEASTAESFAFDERWRVRVDAELYEPDFKETHPYLYHPNGTRKHPAGMDGPAYLADVDKDGKLEVFVETDSWPGQFSFSHDGKYRWSRSFADGNAGAIVRDVDKDGVKEAIFFSDGGLVTALDAKTGGVEWVFDATKHNATPGSIPVPGLVVDLEGDGRYETIFAARHAVKTEDPDWINTSHARYFALDHRGKILWNVSYDWMNPLTYNHPAPADVNEDGTLDVIFLDWNTIGHKPGNWETTSRKSNLFALDGRDGSLLWRQSVTVYWSNKDVVIMDVDGDGDAEVVAPAVKAGKEGLGVFSLRSGRELGWAPATAGWGMTRGPVAGDLYGDGVVHIIVPADRKAEGQNYRSLDVGYREGKLVIIRTDARADGIVFSANFQLNDEIDVGIKGRSGPRVELKPPPNKPPTAAFNVSVNGFVASVDAGASSDAEGALARYAWDWGDGLTGEGLTAQHAYARAGSYSISLSVTDADGATATLAREVDVKGAPTTPKPSKPPVEEEARIPGLGALPLAILGGALALARRAKR